ncbi:hypothetical protein PUMCH_003845 [Australozyma saopauloensis]|uniref:Developmental regulatory protein wetA n=1 Tax=Australozyma saopauloensis TaxID=291208 RepID=A0AAX4HDN8_9ASCO|nr:hypothetical protein PUMCH_003845 [[Candida] saopauloensis]
MLGPFFPTAQTHRGSIHSLDYERPISDSYVPLDEHLAVQLSSSMNSMYLRSPMGYQGAGFGDQSPYYSNQDDLLPISTNMSSARHVSPELWTSPKFSEPSKIATYFNPSYFAEPLPMEPITPLTGPNHSRSRSEYSVPYIDVGQSAAISRLQSQPFKISMPPHRRPINLDTNAAASINYIPKDQLISEATARPAFVSTLYDQSGLAMLAAQPSHHTPLVPPNVDRTYPTISVDLELQQLLDEDPFHNPNAEDPWKFVKVDDLDENLSDLLALDNSLPQTKIRSPPEPRRKSVTILSPLRVSNTQSPSSVVLGGSPRSRRRSSLFEHLEALMGPLFSMADCSNEFHLTSNISFQDETAEVQKRHSITGSMKKKSSTKSHKHSSKPLLSKPKIPPNLGKAALAKTARILKDMEAGLLSFQLPTK